jgi:glycosyltransferase involved in cell wall biosynthesis
MGGACSADAGMRILLVNKYYYRRSGTERYLFNVKRLLEARGHRVEAFAMQHPLNEPATFAPDFPPHVDFHEVTALGRLGAGLRVIWYPGAARRIARVLDAFRPDVVHVFNLYHQLSPSVLVPIARRRIPVIHTLNDYKLICPNYTLYTEGAPCTRCRNRRYAQAIRHRCLEGSLAWSAVAAVEMTLHKALRVYERHVRAFIAPSAFLRAQMLAAGVPAAQVVEIPYFLFGEDHAISATDRGYCAYVGRLVPVKGLATLVQAMREAPDIELWIVGEGPQRADLERLVAEWGLRNVRFTGYLAGRDLGEALAGARFTIVPSEWYEVFGQSIIESFAVGKPVVGARIGGIPEVIDAERDGLLFAPGRAAELAACIRRLWDAPDAARAMGLEGRRKVERRYDPDTHYARLLAVYEGRAA